MHAGVAPDAATGGILTPIHQSTTFVQESIDAYMAKGYSYSRTTNPTVAVLEAKVAELEGAAGSCCFATGMAATATAGAREPRAAAPSSARRRGGARAARPGPRGRAAAEQRVRGEPSGAPDPPVDVRAGRPSRRTSSSSTMSIRVKKLQMNKREKRRPGKKQIATSN